MKNRDLRTNTFGGGLDLDTDKRFVANDKLVDSVNIDITKRGDSLAVTDLKGENILSVIDDSSSKDIHTLAAVSANFLIEPTSERRNSIVVFYTTSELKFIVKALYIENDTVSSSEILLEENISQSDYNLLKNGTVDVQRVGKFGYDVLYFVDNRRQPRKLDCVKYITNENVMTLLFDSEVDNTTYKQINLRLNSSSIPEDAHRVYVYAYKTGGPLVFNPINPSTETVKFVEVTNSGDYLINFDIYQEDYGDYTFQIVYHREGSVIYRNFVIGNPFRVNVSIGFSQEFFVAIRSENDQPEDNQVDSWEFLYNGNSFVVYIDTPSVQVGITKAYLNEIQDPVNYVPDGYYQRADAFNTFFRVVNGVITEQDINNGDVSWNVNPSAIEAEVRAAADLIEEGNINRLQGVTVHVPTSLEVNGVVYNFVNTQILAPLGRGKTSQSNNFTYTLEYPTDLFPVTNYAPGNIDLEGFIISILRIGDGYNVTARAVLSNAVSQNMTVSMLVQAVDKDTQNILPAVNFNISINSGQFSGEQTVYYDENFQGGGFQGGLSSGEVEFGPACILSYGYLGPESINVVNPCS